MWLLVQVVRGSRQFDPETRINNQVLICDTSDLVISGRGFGEQTYRFEARKGSESFTVQEFSPIAPGVSLLAEFAALAQRLGAIGSPASV
jgi:hypothetical protein